MSDHGKILSTDTQFCPIGQEVITIQFFEDGAIKRSCGWGDNYCPEVKEMGGRNRNNCPAYPTWQE